MAKSFIPNTKLEQWFIDISNRRQRNEYAKLEEKRLVQTASAYATHRLDKTLRFLIEHFEAVEGVPVHVIQDQLYPELRNK